jgi:hypothetical protein
MRRAAAVAVAISGCGTSNAPNHTTQTSRGGTPPTTSSAAALEAGATEAVQQDHRLAVKALWSDRVPAKPQGVAGPALADLRRAVAERRQRHLRVRTLSERFHVQRVQVEPTYTTATATLTYAGRVQQYRDGHAAGKPSTTREHIRLLLHRAGDSDRFAVWKVTLIK